MADSFEFIVERDKIQRMVRVEGDTILVGRGQDCQIRIEDPLASRAHCRFERLEGELFLVDLDSANGTWIAGEKIDRRSLQQGDVVRVGSTLLRLGTEGGNMMSASESTVVRQVAPDKRALQTYLTVARTLSEEDRTERMIPVLIDAAVSLSKAERGFVFLIEDKRTTVALGRNFAREVVASPERKVSQTLLDRALQADGPLMIEDAASDGDFAGVASISDLGLRSMLVVPLRHAGRTLGLLVVDHRLQGGAFRQESIDLLSSLAGMAAVYLGALQDRRTAASLRRRTNQLQTQLGRRVRAQDQEKQSLQTHAGSGFSGLLGASSTMQDLFTRMERILESDVAVLVQGESGTGKELVARALHIHGPRAARPFVAVNCGALPDTLLESELFGHTKGAFTGATRERTGRFEEADSGTLFLDEVGEMSEAMQAQLLRVLQEGEIRRLGSDEVRKVDVRVIAATNVDLFAAVTAGSFREDLYYRLRVIQLDMPPLRDRDGDLRLLAEHFLGVEAAEMGRLQRELTPAACAAMEVAAWPGNVRQLRNELRRLTLLGEGPIEEDELSAEVGQDWVRGEVGDDPGPKVPLPERIAAIESAALASALREHKGNRSQAARTLGISRFALLRKLEKYGLGEAEEQEAD